MSDKNIVFKRTGDAWESVDFNTLKLGDEFKFLDTAIEPVPFEELGIWRVRVDPSIIGRGVDGEYIYTLEADPVDDIAKVQNEKMERECNVCKKIKSLGKFPNDKRCKNGVGYTCKECKDSHE